MTFLPASQCEKHRLNDVRGVNSVVVGNILKVGALDICEEWWKKLEWRNDIRSHLHDVRTLWSSRSSFMEPKWSRAKPVIRVMKSSGCVEAYSKMSKSQVCASGTGVNPSFTPVSGKLQSSLLLLPEWVWSSSEREVIYACQKSYIAKRVRVNFDVNFT